MTNTAKTFPTKFVGFCAYKGGVGRTLAAASCANALTFSGLNVVLVDFDVESPGLPPYFGLSSFKGQKAVVDPDQGLVRWAHALGTHQDESIESQLTPLHSSNGNIPGSLRLLPSGQINKEYFRQKASTEWQAWLQPRTTERQYSSSVSQAFREELSELLPKPDFVILDMTAGLDPSSWLILQDIADQLVFFTSSDIDDVRSADLLIKSMGGRGGAVLALSRLDPEIDDKNDSAIKWRQWIESNDLSEDEFPIVKIFHDPALPSGNVPSIVLDSQTGNLNITDVIATDHLRLLKRVVGPDISQTRLRPSRQLAPDNKKKERLSSWDQILNAADGTQIPSYKYFGGLEQGSLVNPTDPDRAANVAFRVTTIQGIFDSIWQSLEPGTQRETAFNNAAYGAGQAYGKALSAGSSEDSHVELGKILKQWCREDTRVGFGMFDLEQSDGTRLEATISIKNAFLKFDAATQTHRIFEGYCSGVIVALIGKVPRFEWDAEDPASLTIWVD